MKVKAQSAPLACIILAAGKGTRMRSQRPKVMHAVAHKPMLMHVVDGARELKPERVIVVTSPEMKTVRDLLTRQYKDHVENVVQHEQKGTGDAVKAAANALKGFTGTVLILYGDTPLITSQTMKLLVDVLKADAKLTVVVAGMQVTVPNEYGRLILDKKGYLERIVEARDATAKERAISLCNSGVMAVRGKYLPTLLGKLTNKNAKKEYYLTDIIALARKEKGLAKAVNADAVELLGVNSRSELATVEAHMQQRLRKRAMDSGVTLIDPSSVYLCADTRLAEDVVIHPNVTFGPNVSVNENVEIRSFCHIEGASIARNAIIGPFARLRPGAVIGELAHVGNFVEIKQATLERGAKANHLSYIGDAEVGANANIGAGTITCNYDGYAKHRTVIGAGAFIGSNSSLVAPVAVGDGAIIGAGSVITEDVDADALAVARSTQKQKSHWAKAFRNRKKH